MPNVIIFADKLKQRMSSSFNTNDTQFTPILRLLLRLEFTRKHTCTPATRTHPKYRVGAQQDNSRSATVRAIFACDYSALRRVPSLVRNPLCEYSTLPNLVEFKTENKESYLEIFLQFNDLIQKDAVVMFQFFDILDTNFVFSSSVNIHISLLCMVRNDALMRFHIQDSIDS